MKRRRLSDAITALAARTFPRARRRDARAVRDCAREAIDAHGLRALPPESLSLALAGMRARRAVALIELRHAPWRAALRTLTLPLATALLLLWTFGFVPRYDHWPLGEGWALLLGGSLLAVLGAALQHRWLTAVGALAAFVAAAAPYVGLGTETAIADTPSFFHGWSVDLGAASLLPTLLLVAGALSLPRSPSRRLGRVVTRLALGVLPSAVAVLALLPEATPKPTYGMGYYGPHSEPVVFVGPPYPMPWLPPSQTLLRIFGIALLAGLVITWARRRSHPEGLLAIGLVLASIAYPLVWVAIRVEQVPTPYWAYNGGYPMLLAALPLLLALLLVRRAARTH
jgi:hypothetical protein